MAGNSSGVAVVEVYELQSDQGQLANVSVRADVLTDENVLINGVILVGGMPKQIVFRAIGPDLRNRNISGELQDPILEVYDANGVVLESNDNWMTSPQAPQIIARGLQPNDQRESAVLLTLTAGHYTAIVRGVNRTTGVGVAEAYRLD
ncbi:MAG TPA: hypothetical protein VG095_01535 [Chthoniobacterales bacterium]|nr:hypothetical protein [Chthoniobacterales bacterium]